MTDRPDTRDRGDRPTGPAVRPGAGRRSWATVALALVLGVVPLAACSGGGDDGSSPGTASGITLPGTLAVPSTSTTAPAPGSITAPTTGPATPGPGAGGGDTLQVGDFVVRSPAACSGATYTANLSWTATGAVAATVLVDGAQVAAPVPVGGPFDVTLGCDGSAHAVTLVLADGAGATMIRTQAVSATPEG